MTVKYSISINDAAVRERIANISDNAVDLFDAFDEIGLMLAENAQENIRQSRQWDGQPLEPLAEATKNIKGRGGDGAIPLFHIGDLSRSYVHDASANGVEVGSNQIQAALMHAGGEAGRLNKRVTIPARPVLGMTADDMDEINDIIADYVLQ